MSNALRIFITDNHTFTNDDVNRGEIGLVVTASLSITEIEVALEGTSTSQIEIAKSGNDDIRPPTVTDTHKFLSETIVVFPPPNVRSVSKAKSFTLPPGTYVYPFELPLPMSTLCGLYARTNHGNKRIQLPPSMEVEGVANVQYRVKTTCKLSSLFRMNLRDDNPFEFTPLDSTLNFSIRKLCVRERIVFKNRVPDLLEVTNPSEALGEKSLLSKPVKVKKGIFQGLQDLVYEPLDSSGQNVNFAFEMRLSDPPCIHPDGQVPFSLYLVSNTHPLKYSLAKHNKPESSNGFGVVYMQKLNAELESITSTSLSIEQCECVHVTSTSSSTNERHIQNRLSQTVFDNSFNNVRFDLKDCVPLRKSVTGGSGFLYELEIPSKYFSNFALPENLPPSFDLGNVCHSYTLNVNGAFSSEPIESSCSEFRNWKVTHHPKLQCPEIRVLSGRNPDGQTSKPLDSLLCDDLRDGNPNNPNPYLDEKRQVEGTNEPNWSSSLYWRVSIAHTQLCSQNVIQTKNFVSNK